MSTTRGRKENPEAEERRRASTFVTGRVVNGVWQSLVSLVIRIEHRNPTRLAWWVNDDTLLEAWRSDQMGLVADQLLARAKPTLVQHLELRARAIALRGRDEERKEDQQLGPKPPEHKVERLREITGGFEERVRKVKLPRGKAR